MLSSGGVSRIKLKRALFKVENKLEPNKRRWTSSKTVSGLNSPADRVTQDQRCAPENASTESVDVISPRNGEETDGQLGRDSAEHDDDQAGYNEGTLPCIVSDSKVRTTRGPRTRSQSLCEHNNEICYRLRLALCFAKKKQRNGVCRARHRRNGLRCRALSYINSNVSVKSGNISIKSTVRAERRGESAEQSLPAQNVKNTGCADVLRPYRGPGRPRKLFVHRFDESAARVKTTIKTEVRRAQTPHASKSRCTLSGRAPNISSKVELKRCLRSGSRKDPKRLVKNSCCALCGDVKYSPPPNKNLAHLLNHRARAGRPGLAAQRKSAGNISKSLQPLTAPNVQFEKYPMVKLCDVARVFAIASRDFSCVLPAILERKKKRKRIRCLKREFRLLVHPQLCGIKKLRNNIGSQSWEVSTPTNSCASFSSGDAPSGASGCEYVSEAADGCVKDCDGYPDGKRMRQVDSELLQCPGVHHVVADNLSVERDNTLLIKNIPEMSEDTSSAERRVPPLILRRVSVNGYGFTDEVDMGNSGLSLDEGEEDNERNDNCEADLNFPENFSCQRTQAHVFFYQPSCARICKTWPFPRSGPPDELRSSLRTGPRWIVTAPLLPTTPTTPACDVQHNLCNPMEESMGSAKINQVLQSCVLEEKPSKPAECESSQSLQRDFEDSSNVFEVSAPAGSKQVDKRLSCLAHVLPVEGGSPKSQPIKNHFLLNTPDQKEDPNFSARCDTKCISNSNSPVSQTTQDPPLGNQEDPKTDVGALSLYNPESLSELCLKVEPLKAQCPSSAMTPSTAQQGSHAVTHTDTYIPNNMPHSSKRWKQRRGFDSDVILDSLLSPDENKQHSTLSSDEEPVKHDNQENMWINDDVRSQVHNKDKSITPPESSESSAVPNSFLDVSRAYEEDVLILDVIQDDPELFGAVVTETIKTPDTLAKGSREAQSKHQTGNHCKIVWDLDAASSSSGCVLPDADVQVESVEDNSSWTVDKMQRCKAQPTQSLHVISAVKSETAIDLNNNQEIKNNNLCSTKVIYTKTARLVTDTNSIGNGYTSKESSAVKKSYYCWYYFNEYSMCHHHSLCRFLHIPKDGDEKFCMERIQKFCFVGVPPVVLRAVELFMGYYSKCSPGVSFCQEIVNSLLFSLLNLGLMREFMDVVNLLLTHKSLPSPEVLLAVFKHVMERGLIDSVSELILLTSKSVEAGCVFTVNQCEVMQNHLQMMQVSRRQMDIFLTVKCRALATNPQTADLSDLAQAVVRVEMLKHREDWCALARVFCDVCAGPHSNTELHRFYCCVVMALLKEPKDKLTVPYEPFAESVCQRVTSDDMVKIVLGRIGVSLIFRYHMTREWNKGVNLVNVMFRLQIEFTTLKGLMGNEYKVSRCQLVTTATELFLHSGSIEGALKMLRADNWFVTSNVWPCEPADIDCRKRVLTLLAGKTSHRDTFDILTNLPGFRHPINGMQVNEYTEMFNAHLRLCVMKQTLPVAADILEFMLVQGIVPEILQLQNLIHKLGKQNNWSRARALFKRARSAGYYSTVVCEQDSLFLPCRLSEIEMTLAFEMFITSIKTYLQSTAGSTQPLYITLRRHGDVENVTESVYLAAGCRLLSAALIPNPKLSIRYTAVNQMQEQLFILDRGSAHKWLSQNEQWALEMWVS